MVTIVLSVLWIFTAILAGIFFLAWKNIQKDARELVGLWEDERSKRIDMEVSLGDARSTISGLIARNAQGWAYDEAQRVH